MVPTPGLVGPVLGHGARRVAVVPGVTQDSPPDGARRHDIRTSLGIAESTCLFLYLGSIGVANGLDVLLDAWPLLPPDAMVVLVGDGSARAEIEQRLKRSNLPTVRLVGAVPKEQVSDWLAASDVCLHLLRRDAVFESALPSKVLEYFGAHRPFVTNVPGLPQRLALASGGGVAEDAPALAAELARWAAMTPEERRRAGERSFAYGRERFGLGPIVDMLAETLESVTRRGRREAAHSSCASALRPTEAQLLRVLAAPATARPAGAGCQAAVSGSVAGRADSSNTLPLKSTPIVCRQMTVSTRIPRCLRYQRSKESFSIEPWASAVYPRRTCAHPVMPGLTRCLRVQNGTRCSRNSMNSGRSGRGPTIAISPRRTFHSCGVSSSRKRRMIRPAVVTRGS